MKTWLVVGGTVGVICILTALVVLGTALASQSRWGAAWACLGAFALITALPLVGIEYADDFWKGRS